MNEGDFYCPVCSGCGEVGCDGIRSFLEHHVRGKTDCKYEESYIEDIILAYKHLELPDNQETKE